MPARYPTADQMLWGILVDVLAQGVPSEARGRRFLDCAGWSGVLEDPRERRILNPVRKMRPGYPAASVAWNLAERDDVDSICWWNPNGRKISDDGKHFYGANYGDRWSGYLDEAIELLKLDPGTRRAFVPIWRPYDLLDQDPGGNALTYSRDGKDVPCTIGFGLKLREDQDIALDMQVLMRSNSAFFVFPYDLYLFSVLQELIANELGVKLGELGWMAMSMHIYEDEIPLVKDAVVWYSENDQSELEPNEVITTTLTNARKLYPEAMDRFMNDQSAPILEFPMDPIVKELYAGAREIADAESS